MVTGPRSRRRGSRTGPTTPVDVPDVLSTGRRQIRLTRFVCRTSASGASLHRSHPPSGAAMPAPPPVRDSAPTGTEDGDAVTSVATPGLENAPTTHARLLAWVREMAELTTPDRWCGSTAATRSGPGSPSKLVDAGTFTRLDRPSRTPSWCASDPSDVARVEDRTYICSVDEADAGPTNNWMDPAEMKAVMTELYRGCMRGRTMYVIPFCMGPVEAESADVRRRAHRLRVRRRLHAGHGPHRHRTSSRPWATDRPFVPAMHSLGAPLDEGQADVAVAVQRHQVHRPVPRGADDLVLRLRATAATRCWARSATRCGSPRSWPATRAGSPSTC